MSDQTYPAPRAPLPQAAIQPSTTPHALQASTHDAHRIVIKNASQVERFWKIKSGLQTLTMLSSLIGLSLVAWIVAHAPEEGFYFEYTSIWSVWQSLLTFGISFVWCAVCIVFLLIRKRSLHPGLRVALDLLLWLGFIGTIMLAMFSYDDLTTWGESGTINASWDSFAGHYHYAQNGTWVYQWDSDTDSYSPSSPTYRHVRTCEDHDSSIDPYDYFFATCAEQDVFLNKLWQGKSSDLHLRLAAIAFGFISVICHFVLFIWACVDCHKHNRNKTSHDAEKLAADIVQTMVKNGAVIPSSAQSTHWGQPGYYQMTQGSSHAVPQGQAVREAH